MTRSFPFDLRWAPGWFDGTGKPASWLTPVEEARLDQLSLAQRQPHSFREVDEVWTEDVLGDGELDAVLDGIAETIAGVCNGYRDWRPQ